ncbi:DUF6777 domain-containing protein [Streptomyces sp. FR-108]|uniref:DUF6777 domain-containing protein n=1 Tax=Streptomyces sp. FR-108 TaxID=3416665 RepID=UPI003CFA5E28
MNSILARRWAKSRLRMAALATVLVLAGGTCLTACPVAPAAEDLLMLGIGLAGPDPFLHALGIDLEGVTSGGGTGGGYGGGASDAFGGTRRDTQCDREQLIATLMNDPGKASAWAAALKIKPRQIPGYVRKLTSVILRKDTVVQNHGYKRKGKAGAYLSVLQAGMAVLVDLFGQPVVKCNCGNPLGQPKSGIDFEKSTYKSKYKGKHWRGFTRSRVSVVEPRPHDQPPMKKITLTELSPTGETTGAQYDRPVGSNGTRDTTPEPVEPSASPDDTVDPSPSESTSPSTETSPPDSTSPSAPGGAAEVTASAEAPVRASPSTTGEQLSTVHQERVYPADCYTEGEGVSAHGRASDLWVRLPLAAGGTGWVTATALDWDSADGRIPPC